VATDRASSGQESRWLAFVASLPVEDPAARMRVLRTLESLGCAVLREGVYLLPNTPDNRQGLQHLAEYAARLNGTCHTLSVDALDETQAQQFRTYFDRSAKYDELVKTVESLKAGFGISDPGSIARVLAKQRREFEAISALDFFPSPSRDQAARALSEAEQRVNALMFPEAPTASRGETTGTDYFKRIWATRRPLWADRLASAWLIRRFIDPEASLLWLDQGQECPHAAVGFGFEGATFSNTKSLVTFEQLLSSFGLTKNSTLGRLGALVHYLDAGGSPIAEAAGVETLLQGARRRSSSDDELFSETEKTFDLLYEAYYESPAKP
jgi:hypothetical protein